MRRAYVVALMMVSCDPGDGAPTAPGGTTGGPPPGTVITNTQCGNGKLDAYELCDDGNTDDGDACNADCTEVAELTISERLVIVQPVEGDALYYDVSELEKFGTLDPVPTEELGTLPLAFTRLGERCGVIDGTNQAFTRRFTTTPVANRTLVDCGAHRDDVCRVADDGSTCGQLSRDAASGRVADVAVSPLATCATDAVSGELVCDRPAPDAPNVPFDALLSRDDLAVPCGLFPGGVWCSGSKVLKGTFEQATAGENLFCGLDGDGVLTCMVGEAEQQRTGVLRAAAEGRTLCTIATDGTVDCEIL